jgi:hypothetical protein
MFHKTAERLEAFTDHEEFERMVLDILSYLEYPGIDPQSPDLADGGKDGLYYYSDQSCVWFAFSLEKRWKRKFNSDLEAALESGQSVRRFVFCSNRRLPALERDKLKAEILKEHGIEVDFFDVERLRVALDTVCKDVRQNYLSIADNTTIRRQLRYVLLDPENEVPSISMWRARETVFLKSSAPRGVFELLKAADLSSVGETGKEIKALSELLDSYFAFRRMVSRLESYAVGYVGQHLPSNDYIPYWQVIAGYCMRIASGWDEDTAMRWSKVQNISHNGNDCRRIASMIMQEERFQSLVSETAQLAAKCDECLEVVQALQSLVAQPRYDL